MNPISNCKVKQQVDFCKYDELSFRFFSPNAPPQKKILSSWKIELRIFNQTGRKITCVTPPNQCILSILNHSCLNTGRGSRPLLTKPNSSSCSWTPFRVAGSLNLRMEISRVNPLPFNRQNQIHAGILKRSFVLTWTPGASSWWHVLSPVHVSCGTFPVKLLHDTTSAMNCASWRTSLAFLRWPFL